MVDINGWVRQARYRSRRHGGVGNNDLSVSDVLAVWEEHEGKCGYCGREAQSLDNPLPLSSGGPNVPANVVPCCHDCKKVKRNRSLAWMHDIGAIPDEAYISLMRKLLRRRGADAMKSKFKELVGLPK